jgi:DNA-binding MarR family transcriptional regulator
MHRCTYHCDVIDSEDDDAAVRRIEAFIGNITAMSRLPSARRRLMRVAGIETHESGLAIVLLIRRVGPLSVTALADQLGVNQSTASRQVVPLEEAGLIRRTPHPANARIQLLRLTDAGRVVCDRVREVSRRDIAWAVRNWEPEDRARLGVLLERFAAEWSAAAAEQGLEPAVAPELPDIPATEQP